MRSGSASTPSGPSRIPTHGYCTDDVARALEVDLLHARTLGWPAVAGSAWRNLRFLADAFDDLTGRFRNVRRSDGSWVAGRGVRRQPGSGHARPQCARSRPLPTRGWSPPRRRCSRTPCPRHSGSAPSGRRHRSSSPAMPSIARAPTGADGRGAPPAGHRPPADVPGGVGGRPDLAVAGSPGDVRERPTGARADRRRAVARLDRDGRPWTGGPRLADRRPDGRGRPSLADRQRLVDPGRGEGHVRPATHRGDLAAARGRDRARRDRRRSATREVMDRAYAWFLGANDLGVADRGSGPRARASTA